MRERPILFSAPMVRAILAGTKSQTRRVVKPVRRYEHNNVCRPDMAAEPHTVWWHGESERVGCLQVCPYGAPGDLLWVREAFALAPACSDPDPDYEDDWHVVYRATESDPNAKWITADGKAVSPWKPSIHMPRWASRITLEVTGVRVERLQAITEEDARAEGVERDTEPCDHTRMSCEEIGCMGPTYRSTFANLWIAINGQESWDSNPWVWVVAFRRVEAQERAA